MGVESGLLRNQNGIIPLSDCYLPNARGFDSWPKDEDDGYYYPYCYQADRDWSTVTKVDFVPMVVSPILTFQDKPSKILKPQIALFKTLNITTGLIQHKNGFAIVSRPITESEPGVYLTWELPKWDLPDKASKCLEILKDIRNLSVGKNVLMIRTLERIPSRDVLAAFKTKLDV
jgi:hypothetical protein